MGLDIRLEAKLSQSLVMTPRLQQAIKLLQYNHMEMVEHVQEAMLENPTLEAVPDSEGHTTSDTEMRLRDKVKDGQQDLNEQQNGEQADTIDWEKVLEARSAGSVASSGSTGGTIHDDLPPIETNLTYGESLADHLLWQLTMLKCGDDEFRAADAIVHNLDERGYLMVALRELEQTTGLSPEIIQDALELVQGLDPVGCGAVDLVECLVIQARVLFPEDENFEQILSHHLHHLEVRNYPAIAREMDLDVEDVVEYHRMIRELEPQPGRNFTTEDPRYITPDVYVQKQGGEWVVLLNEDGMPDLRISKYYADVMKKASKSDKEYLLDKLRGAEFLIRSINKRRKTIRKVMESILKYQYEFFEHGVERLRPLVLQDVADDVGVHMSTVSRVTTNKYVHTPHGILELKYFFSAGVQDMAGEAIKSKIKAIVADEDPKKPRSDQAIANALSQQGIKVARRTVAKYREQLGILPSSKRKRMF